MDAKLDLKDKKIFYLLTENSRLKPKEIASKVGLSKNAVMYRIKRLVSKGYIIKFHPIIDHQKINLYYYDLFLKISVKNEERILNYFSKHPSVVWSATLFGNWDIYANIVAKDIKDFTNILEEITIFLGRDLVNYEVKLPTKRIKLDRNVFDYERETGYKFKPPKQDSKIIALDELDKKILRYLNEKDALSPYNEVAKAVGASLETTRNRCLALLKNGVIVRYAPMIGYEKLGFLRYLVIINLHYLTPESKKDIFNYIIHNINIKLAFETLGKQEIYFLAPLSSPKELENLIKDFRNNFHENILSIEHMLITEELKLDFFPEALEKL